jgi:hypothetical protein
MLKCKLDRRKIFEQIIQEHLGSGVTLFHRTKQVLQVGDVLEPKPGNILTTNYGKSYESLLEFERRDNFPDRPSRKSCVYASLVPRSRFQSYGKLYEVEPVGATHITDSRLIDQISESSSREEIQSLVRQYWEGVDPTRQNIQNIEVLMDSAVIVKVHEEQSISKGDELQFGRGAPVINATFTLREIDNSSYLYPAENIAPGPLGGIESTDLEQGDWESIHSALKRSGAVVVDTKNNKDWGDWNVTISVGPGFECRVISYAGGEPGEQRNESPYEFRVEIPGFDENIVFRGNHAGLLKRAISRGTVTVHR